MSMEKQHRALATSLCAGYGEGGSLAGHSFWGKVTSTWKHSILVLSPHLWKKTDPRVLVKFGYLGHFLKEVEPSKQQQGFGFCQWD